jgi:hypothetical protein
MRQKTIQKYKQINCLISFFIAMPFGAATGYFGLGISLFLYCILKLPTRMKLIDDDKLQK